MRLGPLEIRRTPIAEPVSLPVIEASSDDPIGIIQAAACRMYGVPLRDLVGPSRRVKIVHIRHMAMWAARECTSASLPKIGRRFGGRDHTTVLHAVRKIDALIATGETEFAAQVEALQIQVEAALWREAGGA